MAKRYKKPDDKEYRVNNGAFYAVLITRRTNIPGDERGRLHPVHGYPEHDVEIHEFKRFDSVEDLKAWILSNQYHKFVVLKCKELEYQRDVIINMDEGEL